MPGTRPRRLRDSIFGLLTSMAVATSSGAYAIAPVSPTEGGAAKGPPLVSATEAANGEASARDLIKGSWDPGGASFHDMPIIVESDVVSLGKCAPVPYKIIRDRSGHGRGDNFRPDEHWREIAIELKPITRKQVQCLMWLVLDFSIPLEMTRHADIALARSRSEFDKDPGWSTWGVWGKDEPRTDRAIGVKTRRSRSVGEKVEGDTWSRVNRKQLSRVPLCGCTYWGVACA